jgi:hypothetical protein
MNAAPDVTYEQPNFKELRPDARGRVMLGDWTSPNTRYIAQRHPNGDVTLMVAKLVPAHLVAEPTEAHSANSPAEAQ